MNYWLFACGMSVVGGIVIGMEIGYRQHEAIADKPIVLTKACPNPQIAPAKFTCDAAERRHYREICLARVSAELRGIK